MSGVGGVEDGMHVRGVVLKKNVAHRRMRTSVECPRVLLLAGALEYQRVANKLSSFDMLLEQVGVVAQVIGVGVYPCSCAPCKVLCEHFDFRSECLPSKGKWPM